MSPILSRSCMKKLSWMSYESWAVVCLVWEFYRTYGACLLIKFPIWVSVQGYASQLHAGCAIKCKCLFFQPVNIRQKSADQLILSQSYLAIESHFRQSS